MHSLNEAGSCGCAAARQQREALRAKATAKAPTKRGHMTIHRERLRQALGGRAEVVEAMGVKASGRPGVNAGRMWAFMASSVYQSGDLPVLATRESLQNGIDACRAAIKAKRLKSGDARFDVTWDASTRALTWEDNGIGMDPETILTKFLSLGDSGKRDAADSEEAAGGFGVAKAVILATSPGFRWEMHTRDNLAVSRGLDHDVEIFDAPARKGTRITVFDVSKEFDRFWDHARQAWVPLLDRLRELLAANDLPDVTLTLNGEVVAPMFSRRGGSKVATGPWGAATSATVKAYRRAPGDRQGAYYLRLGGLIQFKGPSNQGNLKADVVVDLVTTARPGAHGYPLNAARDALQDDARWAFRDLVDEVEKENESAARSQEDEVFDPESDDEDERRGGVELADLAATAFADVAFQQALAEASGGIADFYAEQVKGGGLQPAITSAAPAGTRAVAGDRPERGAVLPPGMVLPAAPVAGDITSPVRELRGLFDAADAARRASGEIGVVVVTGDVRDALDRAEAGTLDGWGVKALSGALDRVADLAVGPGGGGLLEVAQVAARGQAAIDAVTPEGVKPFVQHERRNPFGRIAGLRISKKHYDRQKAYRFRKNFQRWMPHLTAWDATLRLVAGEARIRRRFKPGFVLDDEVIGLTATSGSGAVVYLHPDRLEQVVKAHRERPLAIAAFLHGVAVHELTHLDGRMGRGHDESFVVAREDLGHATGHLLPAIAVLVTKVLGLPVKPGAEAKRIAALERQLARAKAERTEGKKVQASVVRLEAELAEARRELDAAREESRRVTTACGDHCSACQTPDSTSAARAIDAATDVLRRRPPPGVDAAYVDAFVTRNRATLMAIVQQARPP
jgi:hypothetical protein